MNTTADAVLGVSDVTVTFGVMDRTLTAVDSVDLHVGTNETVAIVGESGCGKSTLANTLMGVYPPDSGRVYYAPEGEEQRTLTAQRTKQFYRHVQMVMQDPYASLDPRKTVRSILSEPLRIHGIGTRDERERSVLAMLSQVGLEPSMADRFPREFSGGQRQRIAIARALILEPRVIIADEPTSALDVSVQAQIVNLLGELQVARTLSYLVIAHNLALVYQIADRVYVMYLGRVVESGPMAEVAARPQHPYTAALLSASPAISGETKRERIVLRGEPTSALDIPPGCPFAPRCPIARPNCFKERPELTPTSGGGEVACFYPGELNGVTFV